MRPKSQKLPNFFLMPEENDKTKALASEPILPLLVKYSLPAIAGMVVYSLYNVIASIFVGQWIGSAALAGVAIAFPITTIGFALGTLVGLGGAARLSIRLGEKRYDLAHRILGNVVVMGISLGILFGVGVIPFLSKILLLFGADEEIFQPAWDFTCVMLAGAPLTFLFFNLNHLMRASGYPTKAMVTMILSVIVNVILSIFFIKIFEWGMYGAAGATLCAQFAGLIWVGAHFLRKDSIVHFQRGIYRPRLDVMKSITSIGLAPCLMNICMCAIVVLINHALLKYGGNASVAAYGILTRVLVVSGMVVIGITQGMQPIIGYNHGAGLRDRVLKTLRYGVIAGTAITTIGAVICVGCPQYISLLFTHDKELIEATNEALRYACLGYPLVGGPMVLGNFYQAIGRAKIAIIISLMRQVIFLIPLLLFMPYLWGTKGVWLSMPVSDSITFFVNIIIIVNFLRTYKSNFADIAGSKAREMVVFHKEEEAR